jgi:hypothetical protein
LSVQPTAARVVISAALSAALNPLAAFSAALNAAPAGATQAAL